MIKALVFDLDGTTVNTLPSVARAGNLALEELGLPAQPVEDYRYFCGSGSDILMERAMKAAGGYTPELHAEACIINRRHLMEAPTYGSKPYEGIVETLEKAKEKGYKLAVFSNKPDAATREVVKELFGEGLFDAVRGQVAGVPIKPDPAGAFLLLEELKVKPEECIYFGDSGSDMVLAEAAGMYPAAVLWGFREKEELAEGGAKAFMEEPGDILELAKRLDGNV